MPGAGCRAFGLPHRLAGQGNPTGRHAAALSLRLRASLPRPGPLLARVVHMRQATPFAGALWDAACLCPNAADDYHI